MRCMPQVYEAETGQLLQSLELSTLGWFEWVVDNQLVIWGLTKDRRGPIRAIPGHPDNPPYQWIHVLHPATGVVSMTQSVSADAPMAVNVSPGLHPAQDFQAMKALLTYLLCTFISNSILSLMPCIACCPSDFEAQGA